MSKLTFLLGISCMSFPLVLRGQSLDQAEVRIPYGELKQLLARAESGGKPVVPKPVLLSALLRLSIEDGGPVIDATFRTTSFNSDTALLPLVAGDVSLGKQDPQEAVIVIEENSLCLVSDKPGVRTVKLRLLPMIGSNGFSVALPACASVIFETGDLPADQAVTIGSGDKEEALASGQSRPLPHSAQVLKLRLLDQQETREALRPPEPSIWSWQNQALVIPADGELVYQIIARASAADGSGVVATLPLPPDALDVTVSGEDLVSHEKIRGENRSSAMGLVWKTRGILDRQVVISYRMPLRPLDRIWHLQVPGGEGTRTRFIIATSPLLAYAADGLTSPLAAQGLPVSLARLLAGGTYRHLEAAAAADLSVTPIPVAATAEGVVTTAEWALKIEPDGAMLATGVLNIEHKSSLEFVFDTPPGMKLLSCDVAGKAIPPVDLGQGVLKVTLPAQGDGSTLTCSFTGHTEALDPVEGTVSLSLPKVPLFIHSLLWRLDLPTGYQAETHGNLTRITSGEAATRITLKKNLCRDERPEVQVFYQRSDLNR
ncbi:MAG: hypothetical protein ABI600_04050 [Luteolibacter sp.]